MAFVKEEELKRDKPLNCEMGLVEELEIPIAKKNWCRELETRVLTVAEEEEESLSLRCLESGGKTVVEPGTLQSHVSYGDKAWTREMNDVQSENGWKKEKMFAVSNHPSPPDTGVHVTGPMTIDRKHEPSLSTKERKKNTGSGSNVEVKNRARKKIDFETEDRKIALLELNSVKSADVIDISDSEDEKEISPTRTCEIGGKERLIEVKDVNDPTSKKCLGPFSEKREEYDVGFEADSIPLSTTPKRKRKWRVSSDSDSEEDDTVPISKLFGITMPKLSPSSPCNKDVAVSSEGPNVEKLVTPPRRRLLSLRQREEKKRRVDETSIYENTSPNNVKTGASSQGEFCDLTAESDEELVAEEAGSESEGDSLDEFIVSDGDGDGEISDSGDSSRDAEDTVDSDVDFDQILGMIERRKTKDSKWKDEGYMLSSFGKDPILCMKAVCALYRQQTAEEKLMKGSVHLNKRGFSKFDAHRGTYLAEFLTDGSQEGDLVKSVKELEMFDSKGLEDCRKLASRYSKQLFTIYQSEEDPLFGP
ncbi:hypothetical protein C5167_035982 [Papaver somniferum]|uniref:uncharacterized protein LOC113331208 n=1 Tax=Papaver somniferum TaxID=3469 RepID=UPI000E6F9FBC|nr:uncharacterized protein LOC113331208 [Papaver somniferum]XP_026433729.1 uncharacterized protein LOC113331208 [Papaver somniferum]RZC87442.1 hypothetical protein C5167_035982 [Papaver somniferum]